MWRHVVNFLDVAKTFWKALLGKNGDGSFIIISFSLW